MDIKTIKAIIQLIFVIILSTVLVVGLDNKQ